MTSNEILQQKLILFDGICNLCNGSVIFVLAHEQDHEFRFASIQSETGKELLRWCGLSKDFSDTVIYIDSGKVPLLRSRSGRD